MFWVQLPEVGHWRLVIGSPLVRDQGSRVAYERLGTLLREADVGLSLMNISVFEPDSAELSSLLSAVEMSGRVVAGASWLTFGDGVVYRWTGDAIGGVLSCELTQADRKGGGQGSVAPEGSIRFRKTCVAKIPGLLW